MVEYKYWRRKFNEISETSYLHLNVDIGHVIGKDPVVNGQLVVNWQVSQVAAGTTGLVTCFKCACLLVGQEFCTENSEKIASYYKE